MSSLKKAKIDTISNYGLTFTKLFISLMSVPIYLKEFGDIHYGIYILTFGFAMSLSFLDFGSSKSILRYTAEYAATRNKSIYQEALSVNLSVTLASTVVIFLIVCLSGYFGEYFFLVSLDDIELTKQLFYLSAIFFVSYFIGIIPANILQGFQIFHQRNKIQMIVVVLNLMLLLTVYLFHIKLVAFCLFTIALNVVSVFLDIILIYKKSLLGGLKIKFEYSKNIFKTEVFKYSASLFILSLVSFFSQQSDNLVISMTLGFSYVTIYTIISKPFKISKGFFATAYSIIQPMMVREHKLGNVEKTKTIILDSSKMMFVMTLLLLIFSVIFLENIINHWLGTDSYSNYVFWGNLALLNLCINSLYGSLYRYLYFTGQTKIILKYEIISVLVNISLSIGLSFVIGVGGVIVGTTSQFLIMLFAMNKEVRKIIEIDIKSIFNINFSIFILFGGIILFAGIKLVNINTEVVDLLSYLFLASVLLFLASLHYFKKESLLKYLNFK